MASIFDKPKNQSTPADVFKPKPTPSPKSSLTNVTQPATVPKPKPKGGGGGSKNLPQSSTENLTPTASIGQTEESVKEIQRRSTADQIRSSIAANEAARNTRNIFEGESTANTFRQQSTPTNPLVERYKATQSSMAQSAFVPRVSTIKDTADSGFVTRQEEIKASSISLGQEYSAQEQNYIDTETRREVAKETKNLEERKQVYQDAIDNGSNYAAINQEFQKDIRTASGRINAKQNDLSKDFYETKGQYLNKNADIYLTGLERRNELKTEVGVKGLSTDFSKGVGTGAAVGAVGIPIVKSFPKVGSFLGKIGGGTATLGFQAINLGVSSFQGYKDYKNLRSRGFDKDYARGLAFGTGLKGVAKGGTYLTGGIVGAAGVGYTYKGYTNLRNTGRIRGFSLKEEQTINRLINRKDGIKLELVKGRVQEDTITNLDIGTVNKNTGSLRQYKATINTQGLSEKNVALVKRYNLRGTINEQQVFNGKFLEGVQTSVFKRGGFIGPKTKGVTQFSGQLNNQQISGNALSFTKAGRNYKLEGFEFTGKGNVINKNELRFEFGKTFSKKLFSYSTTADSPKLFRIGSRKFSTPKYKLETKRSISKVGTASQLDDLYYSKGSNRIIESKGFKDLAQSREFKNIPKVRRTPEETLIVTKAPSRTFKNIKPSGFDSGSTQQFAPQQFESPQSMAPIVNINTPKFTQSYKPLTTFADPYAGTGQYELTDTESSRLFGGFGSRSTNPTVNVFDNGPSRLNPKTDFVGINLGPEVKPRPTGGTKNKRGNNFVPNVFQGTNSFSANTPITRTKQNQTPSNRNQLKSLQANLSIGGNFGGFNSNTTRFNTPKVGIPFFAFPQTFSERGFTGSGRGKSFKGQYKPSLVALGLNIKSTKIPKLYSSGAGGLIIRPIITKQKRRKKR